MTMKLTFYGHACFELDDGTSKILTDPFLTGNELAAISAEDVETDYVFVTHGHSDHMGDAEAIAKRNQATVCCTNDLSEAVFKPMGLNVAVGNIGGTIALPFGKVKFVQAVHGCEGVGGLPCGFLITMGQKKIYHAGDTALISDMALLERESVDVAILPIGDMFTMGPDDALRAVEMIRPKLVIPMHYDTFPFIVQDPEAFAERVRALGVEAKVLKPGESIEL